MHGEGVDEEPGRYEQVSTSKAHKSEVYVPQRNLCAGVQVREAVGAGGGVW